MIDLRSDTLTKPSKGMRAAMATAEVGDDVYGEDPTVNALETFVADLLGMEAGMFAVSGTQANLCGIMAHCQRGDEYLVGQNAHTYKFEGGGAAVLGSIQPQPIEMAVDGTMDLAAVEGYVKRQPSMHHLAHSKLLCLEDTHNGRVLPPDYVAQIQSLASEHALALHLDGARLWNAAIATERKPSDVAAGFDSVSVCLSKGLGAPAGSVLVGRSDLIDGARRWRKMLGGGIRQAGILAAAGRYAIDHHLSRLSEDHSNCRRLAEGLSRLDGIEVDGPHTNMLFLRIDRDDRHLIAEKLQAAGVKVSFGEVTRIVCHLDISADDVERTIEAFEQSLRR